MTQYVFIGLYSYFVASYIGVHSAIMYEKAKRQGKDKKLLADNMTGKSSVGTGSPFALELFLTPCGLGRRPTQGSPTDEFTLS